MGCVTPVSVLAILTIIAIASGNWGLAVAFIIAAPIVGAIGRARSQK